jgi:hypothetical protein
MQEKDARPTSFRNSRKRIGPEGTLRQAPEVLDHPESDQGQNCNVGKVAHARDLSGGHDQ